MLHGVIEAKISFYSAFFACGLKPQVQLNVKIQIHSVRNPKALSYHQFITIQSRSYGDIWMIFRRVYLILRNERMKEIKFVLFDFSDGRGYVKS